MHRQTKLRVALESLKRLHEKVRERLRAGRGRSLAATIGEFAPLLRGWMSYFCLTEVKGVLEELDGWVRRKLRCLLWRQWKRTITRAKALMKESTALPESPSAPPYENLSLAQRKMQLRRPARDRSRCGTLHRSHRSSGNTVGHRTGVRGPPAPHVGSHCQPALVKVIRIARLAAQFRLALRRCGIGEAIHPPIRTD
jgi:hypothetical protein